MKELCEGLSGLRDQRQDIKDSGECKETVEIRLRDYYSYSKESKLEFLSLANVKKLTVRRRSEVRTRA